MYWRLLYVSSKVCFRSISGGTVGIPESQEVEKTLFTGVSTLSSKKLAILLIILLCN